MPTRSSATATRDDEVNSTPPRLRYNNFGYTVGGPALPSRKKLFFFASQEWRRSTAQSERRSAPVPDPTWLTDPASPEYVPPEARDPNAVKLLTLWPAPNIPGTNQLSVHDHQRARHAPGVRACGLQRQRELVVDGPVSARSGRFARRVRHRSRTWRPVIATRSAISPWWRPDGPRGRFLLRTRRTSCRAITQSRDDRVHTQGRPRDHDCRGLS